MGRGPIIYYLLNKSAVGRSRKLAQDEFLQIFGFVFLRA